MVKFKEGDFVVYKPTGEVGRIKRLTPAGDGAFVVYNCNKDWNKYKDYTAANTNFRDLELAEYLNMDVKFDKIEKDEN